MPAKIDRTALKAKLDRKEPVVLVEALPPRYFADAHLPGAVNIPHDQIDAVSAPGAGCTVYAPAPKPKDPKVDRFGPKPTDSAPVAAWRQRMATEQAKAIYKDRAATAECVNALARGRGLIRVWGRGLVKVKAVALWYALAHNRLRAALLRAAAAGAA